MKKPESANITNISDDFTEILTKLLRINKLNEFLQINDMEYPYYDKWKYKTKDWNIPIGEIWSAVKGVRSTRKFIRLKGQGNFSFTYSTPSLVQQYLHEFDLNLGGSIQSESIIPEQDKNTYLISSIMEEAIASSQIEGAVTTRKVAREMLEKQEMPINKSQQMIFNNYTTMKWIVENKNVEMSKEVLLKIHGLITARTLKNPEYEGSFRDNNDIHVVDEANEIFYTPPDHKQIDGLITQFIAIANDRDSERGFMHPILKGIMLHFLIGYIHPFVDGNGRTARALFYWYLIKKGYWLIEYMSVSRIILKAKAQYAKAYLHTEYDENDLTYFFIYNLKCISKALEELKSYIRKKVSEKNETIHLLKNRNLNKRQIGILRSLLKDHGQYFTVHQVETLYGVSNQTARTDLLKMAEEGLLVQRNIGKQMTFFAAENLPGILKQ